jgi:RHS repeat-associated protein
MHRWMFLGAILSLALIGALLPAVASAAECTDTWTGPAEGSWATAADWSAGHVPTGSDVVCIGAGKAVYASSGSNAAASVQAEGTLSVKSTLELTAGTSTFTHLELGYGGILTGAGDVVVTEYLYWWGGSLSKMTGSGSTVLAPDATALIESAVLKERTFTNDGTVDLTSYLTISEGAVFQNHGTFDFTREGPGLAPGASAGKFINTGTFERTGRPEVFEVEVPFVNDGMVEAQTGEIEFWRSAVTSSEGDWSASEGAALEFWKAPLEVVGGSLSGQVDVESAGMKIEGGVNAASLSLSTFGSAVNLEVDQKEFSLKNLSFGYESRLTGPGDVTASESLTWWGESHMAGTGSFTLPPGATGLIEDSVDLEQTFVNEGTINFTDSYLNLRAGAIFDNIGTFNANSEGVGLTDEAADPGEFLNAGIFEKTSGTGTTKVSAPFANQGEIKELTGHLDIEHKVAAEASEHTPNEACGKAGDPVACATGNFTEAQTDLDVGGRGVGLDLTRSYSAQAAAAKSLGIFGYGWTASWEDHLTSEESGAKETLTEASGGTIPFAKSGASWLGPSWSQDVFSGSSEAGFTLTLPDQTKEKFSGAGRLESVTDRDGNATTLTYNGSGKLETITDPTGRSITLAYNAEGLVEKATDPMGHVVKYAYESKNLKSVTLPGESAANWQFKYDSSHRMTSMTDGRGGKTTNEYDSSSRVISQTDPAGRTLTWKYEAFHTTITNKATGAVTEEWFNSDNQPYSVTRGYGTASASTETFTYTAAGLLASRTDGDGHTTIYGYDAGGDKTSERNAEGDETRWTYNEAHQVLTETQPNGEKTTITRNAEGDPETISRPAPGKETQTVSYGYGPHGEVESMMNPLGAAWTFGYDKYGDRSSETDPEGDERTWTFNEDSQVISTVSPRGNEAGAEAAKFTTAIERDAQGRPIKITDPLGGTTKRAYDADGNVESITDPDGHKTKFTYDADNEQTKVERPNGDVEETGYDGAGQVTSQIDGDKQKTTYVRNVLEEPVETIDPLERKTTRTFDAAGNLLTRTDPEGRTTTYGYDKANRLKEVSYSAEPAQDTTFSYDEDGNLTGMVDGTGTSTYEYDQLDRLTHSEDGAGETVGWEWNLGDEPVGLTYPNGKSISRLYDEDGRLESLTDWLGHTTSFSYNPDSALTATTFPAGTGDTDEYAFDRADRMSGVTMRKGAETLASLAYTRDPAGQVESLVSKGLPGAETESFSYDEDERLTKAGASEYGYDAANNPTKAPGTTNAFDKASQIESATGATFAFDKEGERTKETPSGGPATSYSYSQAGDLTAIGRTAEGEVPAISESLGYDGLGLLASRTEGLSTKNLVWDLTESPEALLSDGEDNYVYGPGGLPVEEISTGEEPTYLHHDQLGSTRLLTNAVGEAAGTFTYGPYGGLTGYTGTATTALGYAGQYTLGQSGLLYLRARYYDPATAQFLTQDPAVEVTHEPYGYAGDNPLRFKDPTGLWFAEELGSVGIPCIPCEAAQGVQELLEPSYEDAVSAGGWVLRNSLGAEELDEGEGEDEAQPCGELRYEIGTRGEVREEEEEETAKLGHSKNSNPDAPDWMPSGTVVEKVLALLGKLFP